MPQPADVGRAVDHQFVDYAVERLGPYPDSTASRLAGSATGRSSSCKHPFDTLHAGLRGHDGSATDQSDSADPISAPLVTCPGRPEPPR